MIQQLSIRDLHVPVFIGVHDWEKTRTQTLVFQIELSVDVSAALISDDLHDTLDYTFLAQVVVKTATCKHYHLIEHLAKEVFDAIKKTDKRILSSKIEVFKKDVIPNASGVIFSLSDW